MATPWRLSAGPWCERPSGADRHFRHFREEPYAAEGRSARVWPRPSKGTDAGRGREERIVVVIGLGIVLIVLGLVFALDVINMDTSAVDTGTLGWILLLAGVVAIIVSLVVNQQRSRSTRVIEDRRGEQTTREYPPR